MNLFFKQKRDTFFLSKHIFINFEDETKIIQLSDANSFFEFEKISKSKFVIGTIKLILFFFTIFFIATKYFFLPSDTFGIM